MAQTDTNGIYGVYDDTQNIDLLSPEEQLIFYKKKFFEIQTDFEEYQRGSSELENELETQLTLNEKRIRDIEAKNSHVVNENELLKSKLEKTTTESRQQVEKLITQLKDATELNDQLTSHIRELEQSNDDLERARRHLDATLSDFDAKLNEQIERNELLESEIGEKEEMQSVIQRLKDEARDLRQELMIQQSSPYTKPKKMSIPQEDSSPKVGEMTPTKSTTLMNGSSEPKTPVNSCTTANSNLVSPASILNKSMTTAPIPLLSASSRISALNIVSELLRKVGALESKLASCRNIMPASGSVLIKSSSLSRDPTNSKHNSPTTSNTPAS